MPTTDKCVTCLKPFQARAGQRFCSPRCRLLHWAAVTLLEAYKNGQADGLCYIVKELGEIRQ